MKNKKSNTIDLKRTEAAALIEALRAMVYDATERGVNIQPAALELLLKEHRVNPLTKCTGEAHSNPFIDNCGICMPRWGVCGNPVRVK
jgi:hypothetical protein